MVSVLLAAHCGEAFLPQQIASILPQLLPEDELLVSDDSPPGHTAVMQAVTAFGDSRIAYFEGPRRGVVHNFEFLLRQAAGDLLVLCDQDDVWLPGKLACVRSTLAKPEPSMLLHDAKVTDEALQITQESLFQNNGAAPGFLRNLIKNSYTGCCMALHRMLLPYILPFPDELPMHDQWIGLCAERLQARGAGRIHWIREPYILYRRHGGTQTGRGSTLRQKIRWRWQLLKLFFRPIKSDKDGASK